VTCSKLLKASTSSLSVLYNDAEATCPVCRSTGRGAEVVRLVPADTDHGHGRPVRVRHAARHARTSEPRPRPPSQAVSLSRRPAERRRWAADLSGPGRGGLVIYGMAGMGKSTLAAQIAARVARLQSSRVMSVMSGEVSAAAFAAGPAEADFIVLE